VNRTVAVQHQLLFVRQALAQMLCAGGRFDLAGEAADAAGIRAAMGRHRLDAVILDRHRATWDVDELIDELRRANPEIRIVTTGGPGARAAQVGSVPLVACSAPIGVFLTHLDPDGPRPESRFVLSSTDPVHDRHGLTVLERRILAALAAGDTTRGAAERLALSAGSVERAKRRIFAKLDVQTRAQAVARAIEAGLLGPTP
jgi:DNA-binding NarL/FixJ family response regulator